MSNLKRSLAPITEEAWQFIDQEARERLAIKLKGRKFVDFVGPKGIEFAAVNTGRRVVLNDSSEDGISYSKRHVLPLIELEVPFTMKVEEIDSLVRGAEDVDTDSLAEAVKKIATAENNAIFYGLNEAKINGILDESPYDIVNIGEEGLVSAVAEGVQNLIKEDVEGPYSLLLGPDVYSLLYKLDDKGYPIKKRLEELLEGEVVPVPELKNKGLLISNRGEDFKLIVGQDMSIGFKEQKGEEIEFFLTESFTFRIDAPEAAIVLE
ncbi:family 1 encapsulin nanocompartment shell protein [Orenia marismortui]|uniref:family 1 encapsulin nanocompartment shell protein n=1 Tax=Orenia marismortui TaxID=46469 RepID=UPI00036E6687|nr:family 1 encapsulin nanocompartment shell protein [Orenia marismortui]